jgi:hypothetical protein
MPFEQTASNRKQSEVCMLKYTHIPKLDAESSNPFSRCIVSVVVNNRIDRLTGSLTEI